MQLNLFDLNLIRALDVLLEERNVTRAAERENITQQAMSGALKRLRAHFDDELLVRVGRHLEPTPLARALCRPVRELMLQVGMTLQTLPSFDPLRSDRHFRIGMSDFVGMCLLPHLMPLLAERAPGIVCEVLPIDDTMFENIDQGRIDFCILPSNWRLYQQSLPRGVMSATLFDDDFICAVDSAHPDVGDELTLEQFKSLPHTIARFGGGIRTLVENSWSNAGLELRIAATATSFTSLIFMVPGTRLVATAQRSLAQRLAGLLPIKLVESPVAIERLVETLSWHERDQNDPAHRFMRETIALAAGRMR